MFEETWKCAHCGYLYESPIGVRSVGHWCVETGFRVWRELTLLRPTKDAKEPSE